MGTKRKNMEDEMSRFEAEISKSTPSSSRMFVPHQLQISKTIGSNTFAQVSQKLAAIPPPPIPPAQLAPFLQTFTQIEEKKESTPVIVSSAPKLYKPITTSVPTVQIPPSLMPEQYVAKPIQTTPLDMLQFEVTKAKKSKTEKVGPNANAEEIIKAAKASSALQSFGSKEKRKLDKKTVRVAGGSVWEDQSLSDWQDDDFRIFCGDLGNDVNDELLTRTFNKYPSFQRAKVIRDKRTGKSKGYGFISFKEPQDFIKAMKEMDGRYVGSRPIKLRKSTWKQRSMEIVRKKEKEKQALLALFKNN